MDTELFDIKIRAVEGGVTAAAGFKAAGIHAGFRKNPERLDYALVVPDKPCPGAGVFTTNRFCAAPVQVSRANLGGADKGYGIIAGVSVNSGNANAATGETGLACARETCSIASQVIGCEPQQILVASTGVIGQILPIDTFETAIPAAYEALSAHGGADAARAIMTTDTHSKEYAVSYVSEAAGHAGNVYTVGGMCKGSGMIMPNMATMIAVITTDAPVEPAALHALLLSTVKQTFNKVTVDSDTSTNDTCIMLASGAAAADADGLLSFVAHDGNGGFHGHFVYGAGFDGAVRGAHTAGNVAALKGGAGGTGAAHKEVPVAEHDLAVGAKVDEQAQRVTVPDAGGQRTGGDVAAHVGTDVGRDEYRREGVGGNLQVLRQQSVPELSLIHI